MTDDKSEKEIAALIAGALKKHQEVNVRGLGTFSVQHQKQVQQQEKDGRILLSPPCDTIIFTSEK